MGEKAAGFGLPRHGKLVLRGKAKGHRMTFPKNTRQADHPVDAVFLNRHSPRAFTDVAMEPSEMLILLEAARWAPSASNVQPWRFAWGLRGDAGFAAIEAGLMGFNKVWAGQASALVVLASTSVNGLGDAAKPVPTHAFDAGAAWMSLALQARMRGWEAHAMAGIEKAQLAAALALPAHHEIHVVIAIGQQGDMESLPQPLQEREVFSPRLGLEVTAARGRFVG